MSDNLNWRVVTKSNSHKFMVKGTVLNHAICGPNSRYLMEEVRCYDKDRNADRLYMVRDAHTVSDAQVAESIRPKVMGWFDTLELAMEMVNKDRELDG